MNQILEQLGTYGIVPVVVLQDAAKAEPLAEALCKGGLACAEVTFRTDAAEESIRIMSSISFSKGRSHWKSTECSTHRRPAIFF